MFSVFIELPNIYINMFLEVYETSISWFNFILLGSLIHFRKTLQDNLGSFPHFESGPKQFSLKKLIFDALG